MYVVAAEFAEHIGPGINVLLMKNLKLYDDERPLMFSELGCGQESHGLNQLLTFYGSMTHTIRDVCVHVTKIVTNAQSGTLFFLFGCVLW